jgi:hypothetical protein
MSERHFELLLASGAVATWDGTSGENAAVRYVDCHRDETVVAWREPRYGLFVGSPRSG